MKTLSGKETLVIHSTAVCRRQRSSPGDNQDALSGRQLTSPEQDHVRSFSGHKPRHEDHLVTSVFEQTIKKYQEMSVTGDQTLNLDRWQPEGEHFPDEGQVAALFSSQSLHPSQVTSSAHTSCGYRKKVTISDATCMWFFPFLML